MTRRARLRLVIVLVVLGLPALLVALGAWYLASGKLERRIAAEYRARLPGELSVGKVQLAGLGHAELLDVAAGPAGAPPAIRATRVTVRGSLARGAIRSIDVEGLRVRLDAAAVDWLREVAARAATGGSGGAQGDIAFAVAGAIDVGGLLPIDGLVVRGEIRGGRARARLVATLANEPVELFLDHEDAPAGVRHVLEVRRAAVRLAPLFHALEAVVGMKNQDDVLEWLPPAAELADTRLVLEPGATAATGPFAATWRGGEGGGRLTLSRDGLALDDAHARDRELGEARGRLALGFAPVRLEVDVPAWTAGPRVPIPEQVPRELFALLPAAHLVTMEIDDAPRLYLTFAPDLTIAGTRHLDLWWQKREPLRIFAEDLPARLARPWIPKAIDLRDGRIARFDLRLGDGGLRSLEAVGDGVVVGGEEWSLADLAPTVTLVPLPDDGGLDAQITGDGLKVRHRGDGDHGRLEIAVQALDALAAHVRGPRRPPPLKGAASVDVAWRAADDGVAGDCTAFSLGGLAIGASLSGVEAHGRGAFAWRAGGRSARLDGALTAGELRVAGKTVPLAVRTPQFTVTVEDEAGQLALKEILARASGDNGFTVGVHGRLNRESLDGELTAEIDRADLGWLSEHGDLVPLPKKAKLVGDVAMTATARIADGEVQRVDGWLLPLGTDLSLADGQVQVSGIKGAIAWHLAPPDAPPAK